MKRVFQKVTSLSFIALLGVLSFGAHASALPQTPSHDSGSTNHSANSSSCITICTAATPYKDEFIDEISEDDDDKDRQPFYLLDQPSVITTLQKEHEQRSKIALAYEPPPGLPAYILLTVFRT